MKSEGDRGELQPADPGRKCVIGAIVAIAFLALTLAAAPSFLRAMNEAGVRVDPTRALLDLSAAPFGHAIFPFVFLALVVASCAAGAILLLRFARHSLSWDRLFLDGSALSFFVFLGLSLLGDLGMQEPGRKIVFTATLLVIFGITRAGRSSHAPRAGTARGFLCWVLLPILVIATLTIPKIFWEAVTGDGAHAFEAARLVLHHRSPFFSADVGSMSGFPGPNSLLSGYQAWPLMTWLGESVAALRLGAFLNLGLLAAALRLLVPAGSRDRISGNVLMWLVLLASFAALSWSAGYDPYSADLALPASQDLLYLALFVAAVGAWLEGRMPRFLMLGFLLLTASPGGGFLLLTLPVARFLARGETPFRAAVRIGLGVLAVLVLHAAMSFVAARFWGMESGEEHGLRPLLRKLRFVDFGDPQRFLWLVPGGLFPLLAFLRWRTMGAEARMLAISAIISFVFFYLQLKTNLHYFCAAMILPLAAHLRSEARPSSGGRLVLDLGLGLLALVLSLPVTRAIAEGGAIVGESLRPDGEAGYEEAAMSAYRAMPVLALAFPPDHDLAVPEEAYGGSALTWHYHAQHPRRERPAVLALTTEEAEPPAEATALQRANGWVLWLLEPDLYRDLRQLQPIRCHGRDFLRTSRDRMFGSRDLDDGPLVIDLKRLASSLGLGH